MKDKLLKIVNTYGIKNQLKKLSEEVYELQEAILCGNSVEHVTEELADVMVLVNQIRVFYNIEPDKVNEVFDYKVDRQIDRIKKSEVIR